MGEAKKLYAVPLQGHSSLPIADWCWGSCGKGLIGGIVLGEKYGEALPCATPAAECPHFDKEMKEPWGTVEFQDGEHEVYLRKLKALDA